MTKNRKTKEAKKPEKTNEVVVEEKITPVVTFGEDVKKKINFYLNKFENIEWSGPAWFKVEENENGLPVRWELVHFHLLDIGTSGNTEWERDLQMKNNCYGILEDLFGDECENLVEGNIHSHHNMSSFFSGVDKSALNQHARVEGEWPSMIVSRDDKKNRAFAFSYSDRFGQKNAVEIAMSHIEDFRIEPKAEDSWLEEIAKSGRSKASTSEFGAKSTNKSSSNSGSSRYEYKKPKYNTLKDLQESQYVSLADLANLYDLLYMYDSYKNGLTGGENAINYNQMIQAIENSGLFSWVCISSAYTWMMEGRPNAKYDDGDFDRFLKSNIDSTLSCEDVAETLMRLYNNENNKPKNYDMKDDGVQYQDWDDMYDKDGNFNYQSYQNTIW